MNWVSRSLGVMTRFLWAGLWVTLAMSTVTALTILLEGRMSCMEAGTGLACWPLPLCH